MSQYTTNVSDKRKGIARHRFLISGFGMLGLHYFYVGKVKRGLVHLFASFIFLMVLFSIWTATVNTNTGAAYTIVDKLGTTAFLVVIAVILNVRTFCNIQMGKFKDNIGAYLREE